MEANTAADAYAAVNLYEANQVVWEINKALDAALDAELEAADTAKAADAHGGSA